MVRLGLWGPQGDQELMAPLVRLDLLANKDQKAKRATQDNQESLDEMVLLDLGGPLGSQVWLALLDRRDQWELLADEDQEVNLDLPETGGAQEKMVHLVYLVPKENRALQDLQVRKVTVECPVHLELKVLREVKEHKVNQDLRDLVDRKVPQAATVLMVQKERPERKDHLERMGCLEILVEMVYPVSLE